MKSNLLLTILMAVSLLACKQSDSTDDTSSDDTDTDIVDIWEVSLTAGDTIGISVQNGPDDSVMLFP